MNVLPRRRARRTAARPTSSRAAAGSRCASTATTRRSTSPSSAPAPAARRSPASWRRRASRSSASTPARTGGRSRTSPPTRPSSRSSTGPTSASAAAPTRSRSAATTPGRGVGGSTVHFSMISLRWRPEWFKSRSLLGYGVDWPIAYDEIAPYYAQAERALSVSGPVRYPWGPPRGAYPYRPHPSERARRCCSRAAPRRSACKWAPTPLATVSAPRGKSPPCVYRGFCNFGCSTNAKQSALVVWAHQRGARPAPRSATWRWSAGSRPTRPARAHRRPLPPRGRWRFQTARNVVVAGYAIETPRLLLNSATRAASARPRPTAPASSART